MGDMSKSSFIIFFCISLIINKSCLGMGLYNDLSNKRDVLIINYIEGCRFCKTLIDYANDVYAYLECSKNYDVRQRFSLKRGKSNQLFSYLITNNGSADYVLKTYPHLVEEFFIVQNKNGSNMIISSLENLCLTNPLSVNTQPYHISPNLNNMNLLFSQCIFDSQKDQQEFYFESSIDSWLMRGKINIYYFNSNVLVSNSDIDLIKTHYPEYRFILFNDNEKSIQFIPNSSSFDIGLPINENIYYLGNNFETIAVASSHNCVYLASPKDTNSGQYMSPFITRNRCEVNNSFALNYYLDKLNKVEFKFINVTLGSFLNSSYLSANSDIVFTNSLNGKVHKYNLATSSFNKFNAELSFGNYSTSISIKTNPNFESTFQGLNFSVNDCNFLSFNIPFREKINTVTFTIKNEADGSNLTTSCFLPNSNIVFTRTSNVQTYTYNVGSGSQGNFSIQLHHDTYSIASTSSAFWIRLTNSIIINDYSSVSFDIIMREASSLTTFSFKFSNIGNEVTDTCVFQNNTILTFRLTDNRTSSYTVNGCNSTIAFNLFLGTWVIYNFTIASSSLYTISMNSGQSFTINSSNNSYFDVFLTKVKNTSLSTFSFKFSNLNNQSTDSCVFQNNSILRFKMTDNSLLSYTINGCSTTISVNMYIGSWQIDSFTLVTNPSYTLSMNANQTFSVQNTNNSYFDILLSKVAVIIGNINSNANLTFPDGSKTFENQIGGYSFSLPQRLDSSFTITLQLITISVGFVTIGFTDVPVSNQNQGYVGGVGITGQYSFASNGVLGINGNWLWPTNLLLFESGQTMKLVGNNGTFTLYVNDITKSEYIINSGIINPYLSFTFVNIGNSVNIP